MQSVVSGELLSFVISLSVNPPHATPGGREARALARIANGSLKSCKASGCCRGLCSIACAAVCCWVICYFSRRAAKGRRRRATSCQRATHAHTTAMLEAIAGPLLSVYEGSITTACLTGGYLAMIREAPTWARPSRITYVDMRIRVVCR